MLQLLWNVPGEDILPATNTVSALKYPINNNLQYISQIGFFRLNKNGVQSFQFEMKHTGYFIDKRNGLDEDHGGGRMRRSLQPKYRYRDFFMIF